MDLLKAIKDLHEEKKRLDAVISSLEMLLAADARVAGPVHARKRGRKSMSPDERQEVSERMKRYWAARRDRKQPQLRQAFEEEIASAATA